MVEIIQDVYYCSEFKKINEYNYNFNVDLDVNIDIRGNDKIKFKLIDFSIMNAMLNISNFHKNNLFKVRYNSIDYNIIIPDGSYTATILKDVINTLLSDLNIPLNFNYDKSTNKYILESTAEILFYPLNCALLFGFINEPLYYKTLNPNIKYYSETFTNMLPYSKIILTSDLVLDTNTQQNFLRRYNSNLGISNIICWFSRDIPLFSTINYNNNNNELEISNKNIKNINFNIINEYQEFILDAPSCYMHFQLIIYDSTNWYKKFYNIINDIAYYLLSSYFKK
jgi:hypothetical protein